jgi:signal transduction histidine kinase
VHSFTRDVTARRRADGERLRAQRLEALGRLAASVAHDFNNLLAVMLAAVEQATEAVPDDAELKADLAEAAGAARRGRALTRQLLTFAKQEETRPQLLDVNARVVAMQELLRRLAGSGAEVTLALAPDAGAVVADPSQLDQVLLNLVTNARDAMPGGGRIRVETAREDGSLRLTVRDTGAGVPPEVRPHLFEPFFTTKADGHGLGLSTVYGVVTGAGGRVEVESEPGQGAAFHLWLPRAG